MDKVGGALRGYKNSSGYGKIKKPFDFEAVSLRLLYALEHQRAPEKSGGLQTQNAPDCLIRTNPQRNNETPMSD